MVRPNPESLSMVSDLFWLDPSHLGPYRRLLARMVPFLAKAN